jgi:hypothetical protein
VRAAFSHEVPFAPRAAILVARTANDIIHAGVTYDGGKFVHLGNEDATSSRWPTAWQTLWAIPDVEPEELVPVAAMCRLVWELYQKERRFPYALDLDGARFGDDGRLIPGEHTQGLTCATFAVAVFGGGNVELIKEDTWPVRTDEDREWLAKVKHGFATYVYARLAAEVDRGVQRIRPEEVLGACNCEVPAHADEAIPEGKNCQDRLMAKNAISPPNSGRST